MWLNSTNKAFVCLFILCICYCFALLLGTWVYAKYHKTTCLVYILLQGYCWTYYNFHQK